MTKQSAGLMMYRRSRGELEVFLIHPGGPIWAKKDNGAWSIPKGRLEDEELALDAAIREFKEETGFEVGASFVELGTIRQKSGKLVEAWAFEGDCDPEELKSNLCEIEWPPRSGRRVQIPEVDRGGWFSLVEAAEKIRGGQELLLERLAGALGAG